MQNLSALGKIKQNFFMTRSLLACLRLFFVSLSAHKKLQKKCKKSEEKYA